MDLKDLVAGQFPEPAQFALEPGRRKGLMDFHHIFTPTVES
jgi:hypothetical protein